MATKVRAARLMTQGAMPDTPPLESGDRLTRREFERRYRAMPDVGGRSHVDEDEYVEGAPELIVEIAGSSAAYDLHDKMHAYRRSGVQEYLVWQVYDKQIAWWELLDGKYQLIEPDEAGVIDSRIFPGLRLAVPALLEGDLSAVLATLQQGLAMEAHKVFVARLAEKKGKP